MKKAFAGAAKDRLYHYRAVVTGIVDGDTLTADVDLGFHIILRGEKIRLARINAPELSTAAGELSKSNLAAMLPAGQHIIVKSAKREKYGRLLGEVWIDTQDGEINLSDFIKASSWAGDYGVDTPTIRS